MDEPETIPITFLEREVVVEWRNGNDVTGKIGEYVIGKYIILLTKQADHLIPWNAISTVWYQTEEQKATLPQSRKTREKQKEFPELPKSEDLPREIAESETISRRVELKQAPAEAADVVNWDPAKLEWETVDSKSGKGPYERYPFIGHDPENRPDYVNLRDAILAVKETGKHVLGHKESGCYYWLDSSGAVIMRRKSNW